MLTIRRNDEQTIGSREGCKIARSLPLYRLYGGIIPVSRNLCRQEPRETRFRAELFAQARFCSSERVVRCIALECSHQNTCEQFKSDHCRDGIPRPSEEVRPVLRRMTTTSPSHYRRLPWLDLHASEQKLGRKIREHVLYDVVLTG